MEERKRAAHKGRCDPLEWRTWPTFPTISNLGSGVKTVGRDLFPVSGNTLCSKGKACMRLKTEEEEMQQQQRMKTMSDRTRKIKEKDRNGREQQTVGGVSDLLAADC